MGYLDRLTESAFKETQEGVCVYYPNGIISKGRVVPNSELRSKIYSFHKNNIKYGVLGAIILGFLLGKYAVIAWALVLPIHYYFRHKLIGNLEKHNSKITVKEIYKKAGVPGWYKILLLVISFVGFFLSLLSLIAHDFDRRNFIMLGVSIICLGIYIYLRVLDRQNKI